MSTKAITALDKYTAAVEKRNEHITANKSVFTAHEQIVNSIIDAENELRDAVAETGAGVSNEAFRVTLVPQTQTWGDIEEVDKFVAGGKLSKADRDQIVKTQTRPPRITITAQRTV